MKYFLTRVLDPHWHVLLVTLLTAAIIASLYRPIMQFYPLDKKPPKSHEIAKTQLDLENIVETGIAIKEFTQFDIVQNKFAFDGIVWFLFDPRFVDQEKIGKFEFTRGEISSLSAPYIFNVDGKKLFWYDVKAKFNTNLHYQFFPVDSHRISFTLYNPTLTQNNIELRSDPSYFTFYNHVHTPGWQIINMNTANGFRKHNLTIGKNTIHQELSRVIFSIDCMRTGIRHLLISVLPLFLMYLTALLSLLMGFYKKHEIAVEVVSASLAAMIAYRFVLESISPSVSYFMISDYIYLLLLSASFVVYLLILLPTYLPDFLRGALIIFLQLTIVAFWYYYFNVWLRT